MTFQSSYIPRPLECGYPHLSQARRLSDPETPSHDFKKLEAKTTTIFLLGLQKKILFTTTCLGVIMLSQNLPLLNITAQAIATIALTQLIAHS